MRIHIARPQSVLVLAVAAGLALALAAPTAAFAAARQPLSAGVGLDNRAGHPDYPLKLIFATSRGHYLADIAVTLTDSAGKEVLKAHASGPWLFLDVPAGTYTVRALRKNGTVATARIEATGAGQALLRLTWQAAE